MPRKIDYSALSESLRHYGDAVQLDGVGEVINRRWNRAARNVATRALKAFAANPVSGRRRSDHPGPLVHTTAQVDLDQGRPPRVVYNLAIRHEVGDDMTLVMHLRSAFNASPEATLTAQDLKDGIRHVDVTIETPEATVALGAANLRAFVTFPVVGARAARDAELDGAFRRLGRGFRGLIQKQFDAINGLSVADLPDFIDPAPDWVWPYDSEAVTTLNEWPADSPSDDTALANAQRRAAIALRSEANECEAGVHQVEASLSDADITDAQARQQTAAAIDKMNRLATLARVTNNEQLATDIQRQQGVLGLTLSRFQRYRAREIIEQLDAAETAFNGGLVDDAEQLLTDTVEQARDELGETDRSLVRAELLLADVWEAQGKPTEAGALVNSALNRVKAATMDNELDQVDPESEPVDRQLRLEAMTSYARHLRLTGKHASAGLWAMRAMSEADDIGWQRATVDDRSTRTFLETRMEAAYYWATQAALHSYVALDTSDQESLARSVAGRDKALELLHDLVAEANDAAGLLVQRRVESEAEVSGLPPVQNRSIRALSGMVDLLRLSHTGNSGLNIVLTMTDTVQTMAPMFDGQIDPVDPTGAILEAAKVFARHDNYDDALAIIEALGDDAVHVPVVNLALDWAQKSDNTDALMSAIERCDRSRVQLESNYIDLLAKASRLQEEHGDDDFDLDDLTGLEDEIDLADIAVGAEDKLSRQVEAAHAQAQVMTLTYERAQGYLNTLRDNRIVDGPSDEPPGTDLPPPEPTTPPSPTPHKPFGGPAAVKPPDSEPCPPEEPSIDFPGVDDKGPTDGTLDDLLRNVADERLDAGIRELNERANDTLPPPDDIIDSTVSFPQVDAFDGLPLPGNEPSGLPTPDRINDPGLDDPGGPKPLGFGPDL